MPNHLALSIPLEDLKSSQGANPSTNINLTNVQELPLYLMGSKYLETKIKTLKERKDEELFIEELHALDLEINTAKNDRQIAQLKARESDEQYIKQLNVLDDKIAAVKHDQKLQTLLNRQSDDPFIPKLSETLVEIERLQALSFDFSDVKMYVLDRAALITGIAIKPKRSLIVVLGALVSGILAFIVVLLNFLVVNHKRKQQSA